MTSTSVFISATEARQNAQREYRVHTESKVIEDAILTAVSAGYYETTLSSATPMTDNNPITVAISAVINNSLTLINHPYRTGTIVKISSNGIIPSPLTANTYYYVIYIDANTIKLATSYANAIATIPQCVTITGSLSGTTAVTSYPDSRDYYAVWTNGTPSNSILTRPYQDQMNNIVAYFTNMGYTILQQVNPSTNTSFQWYIKW